MRLITGLRGGRNPHGNSLLIESAGLIIDSAGDEKLLAGIAPRVQSLLLTHFHPDHFRNNHLFGQARLYIHEAEAHALSSIDKLAEFAGTRGSDIEERWREMIYEEFRFTPRDSDQVLRDGEQLEFGNTLIEVIHTPGHSPGHCCFWFPHEQVLVLADIDLTRFGPWYGNTGSDIDDFQNSLQKIKNYPAKLIVTGHERGLLAGESLEAELTAYALHFEDRDQKILEVLSDPCSCGSLVGHGLIYPLATRRFYLNDHFEAIMLKKHLDRLCRLGRVQLVGPDKYVKK